MPYLSVDYVDVLSHGHRTENLDIGPHLGIWSKVRVERYVVSQCSVKIIFAGFTGFKQDRWLASKVSMRIYKYLICRFREEAGCSLQMFHCSHIQTKAGFCQIEDLPISGNGNTNLMWYVYVSVLL